MENQPNSLEIVQDIKRMMERSSRFISLSGWSGIAAGSCALVGAYLANKRITGYFDIEYPTHQQCIDCLKIDLLKIAAGVFMAALLTAFSFTYIKSKKDGTPIWGNAARRLLWNTLIPMIAGGFLILRMIELKHFELIAPTCLIFYGLALVNGSKYTIGEVKYLGYAQLITGIINLWLIGYGITFWAIGFGILHIIYGVWMWWKYERSGN